MAATFAVCIAGLERSLNSSIRGYEKYVLEPLQADAYYDVQTSSDRVAPLRRMLSRREHTKFVEVSADSLSLKDTLTAGHVANMTWYPHLLVRDTGQPYGALNLWIRWKHCTHAMLAHEIARGGKYEYVAYSRTDLHWYGILPELSLFGGAVTAHCPTPSRAVFVLEGEEYAGTNDRFFLLPREHAFVVGTYLWDTVSTYQSLDVVFSKFIASGLPLTADQLFGIEILVNILLLSVGMCILKITSVAALLRPSDGHAKSFLELSSAKFFGQILEFNGVWEVVRSPFLVGGRCGGLPGHCCNNLEYGGYADCWYWFRDFGPVRLYSILRCCDAHHVHIAPIPSVTAIRKAVTYIHENQKLGLLLDPQVAQRSVVPIFRRSGQGVFCERANESVLRRFVLEQRFFESAEATLAECESYCWDSAECNACSVYVNEGIPEWHAIPACGARIPWVGAINGDISERDYTQQLLQARNNRFWFCSPFQPEDSTVFEFKPDKFDEIQNGASPYDYMPIGSFQCYNVDFLMARYGYEINFEG